MEIDTRIKSLYIHAAMKNTKNEKSPKVGEKVGGKRETSANARRESTMQAIWPDGLEWEQKTDGKNRIQ
jgi:hypothetical protein